jgi:hypothetical protein
MLCGLSQNPGIIAVNGATAVIETQIERFF